MRCVTMFVELEAADFKAGIYLSQFLGGCSIDSVH